MASIRQFSVFVLVGLICAVIDIAVMQILIQAGLNPLAAASGGFFAGLVANFLLHSKVTFQSARNVPTFLRFSAVVALNYMITIGCVAFSVALAYGPLPGKLASLPIIAINGFFLSKRWVFK